MNDTSMLDHLRCQYSFLGDKAAVELWNALSISEDHNSDLTKSNTLLGRMSDLAFGHQQQQQHAINSNLREGVSVLVEYCQQLNNQIARTARGVTKLTKAVLDAREKIAGHDELLMQYGNQLSGLESRLDYVDQRIEARDQLQRILDIWKVDQSPLPVLSQLLLVISELKWSQFGVLAQTDESLRELGKTRLITVACEKFSLNPKQLMAVPAALEQLQSTEGLIQDITRLTLDEIQHPLMDDINKALAGQVIDIQEPAMSFQRLTHEFYDSSLKEVA